MTCTARTLLMLGAAVLLAPGQAGAQRSQADNPSMRELIEQLQPGRTRGIRIPGQPPSAAAPSAQPTTTAPPGTAAASIMLRFATGSATLTLEAERSLDELGRALASPDLAPYRFRIEGHTDTVGGPGLNQALSERRAAAVRDYLTTRHGVSAARLESIGLGESQPLVATPDETAQARNRRVQIINLGS
ncbi:OmpA family protein [Belnapia sp. T18]|uniref:OmpA family protein n=1 Tax=Belnapia arida TaxID=2804533 RepID=A0ABS1TY42_9PROT|nr:OmpA family protein [Belnapia arida]MBL6077160.1 OmpA family protein [Belnapia arida]